MKENLRVLVLLLGLIVPGKTNAQSYFFPGLFLEQTIDKKDLLFDPITSVEELSSILDSYSVKLSEIHYDRYRIGKGTVHPTADLPIFKLDYSISSKSLTAYSYLVKTRPDDSVAFLVIPGTGSNQSTALFHADVENYHGDIITTLQPYGEVHILLKKNEDCLALHDGFGKLTKNALIASLINRGGSYGALYLSDGIALIKYLKSAYKKVFVIGLSQGGEAAFILSLLSEPSGCVAASGYSVLWNEVYPSDIDGLLMFDRNSLLDTDSVKATIANQSTKYLLTYGTQDYTTYTMLEEGLNHTTCSAFEGVSNIQCFVEDHGHTWPTDRVIKFVTHGLPPRPAIVSENDTLRLLQGSSTVLTAVDPLSNDFTWYKDGEAMETGQSDYIEVTSDGTFQVMGTNEFGVATSDPVTAVFYPDVSLNADSVEYVSLGKNIKLEAIAFPGNTYRWFNGAELIASESAVIIKEDGTYYVEITTAAGVKSISRTVTVFFQETLSVIEGNAGINSIQVFLGDEFSGPANVTIFDAGGKKTGEFAFEKLERQHFENFDLSSFPAGMYIVNLRGNDFFAQKKIVITN